MSKIDVKFHCIDPSRPDLKKILVLCLLCACFGVMSTQPAFAETYGFEEDATLNNYDPVPSGTAYGPSPGFYFTNFYFLSGVDPPDPPTPNGTNEFYTDERWTSNPLNPSHDPDNYDKAWFVTSDGSEVTIVSIDIAAWSTPVGSYENPDLYVLIEGLKNGALDPDCSITLTVKPSPPPVPPEENTIYVNTMCPVTLNWSNIDQIRFTGADPSALAELQLEIDNLVFETPPFVQSINRADPNPTNAISVNYTVTFTESVTGVDTTDFTLSTTGISGASVASFSGSGSTRTVTVSTGSGDGTLRLDLVDDDTILDGDGNPLGGTGAGNGNFTGQTYTIDRTGPTVSIGAPSVSDTNTGPVSYTVTYTGADTVNLTSGDVTLNKTGTADGIVSVSNGTTTTPTVTISSITGDGTLGISIVPGTSSDTAGNTDSGAGPSAIFIVDNTPPPPPSTPDLLASSDTGSSDTDDVTSDTTPDFTGTAEANSTVELSSDINGSVGTGPADGAGNWTITASTLSEGPHNITATATDAAGNTSSASPALSVTIDTSAPPAPSTPDLLASSDTGSSDTDDITSDTTPDFTGTAEANSTVELSSDINGSVGTGPADGAGNWTITASTLSEGPHNITATATDAAGNTSSASPALSVTIDTSVSAPSTPDMTAASDTGSSDTDDITSDTTPDFTGTAEANSTVELSSDINGSVGTGPADGAGNWTITASTLSEGTHNITATATDAAGNTSSASPALSVTIDTVPPVVSSIVRADPNPTSASSVDFTVTFSEDVSGVDTGDFDLTVTGSVTGTVDSVTASSVATVTVGSITGDGTLRLDVDDNDSITDTAGNPLGGAGIGNGSYTAGEAYTIDNTPPTVSIGPPSVVFTGTGPVDYIVTYTGADTVNLTSGDVTLNKTGTADGIVSVSNGTTATPTVTISSITGDGTLGITIASGTSSDTAGNTDTGAGPSATFIVDNTPPPPPSTPDLLASSDTGSSDTDDITSDTTPDFTGTAEANSTVELSSDINGSVGTGPADGAGNWTITASTLSEGTHNITATATDAVGKTSLPSPALSVIITLNPVARDDQYTTNENTTLNVPAPGVLGNDVDVHGNALTVQSVDTTGTIGLVSINPDGSFTYTPAGGFAGYDSFTYVVMEGGDGTDTGTVSITVNCRNQRSIKITALDFALDGTTLSGSFSMKNDSKGPHDAQVIGTQIGLECRLKKEKKETEWMEIETENHVFTPAPPVVFSDDLIIAFTCDLMEAIPDGAKSLRVASTVEVFGAKKSFVFRSSQELPSSGASFFAPARLSAVPEKTNLGQNFRNPFNPDTWIPYQLARDVNVTIRIYSIPGRLIRTLDLGRKPAGFYTTKDRAAYWDGRNESGESVSSGIYFYQIQAGEFSATRKMTILK